MGAYWLHDLPKALKDAGLQVETWPGWETRSRASGGFDDIRAVFVHHTAGGPNQVTKNSARQQYELSDVKPVGNITLGREGLIIVGAAGASNTQGAGGPVTTSKGVIPIDQGNRYGVAIEACNRGTGEAWTAVQLDAYRRLCAVICRLYGLDPLRDIFAHYEWTTRKIDPAGGKDQYPYGNQKDAYFRWDMGRFRSDVHEIMNPEHPDMNDITITDPVRILDTREGTPHNAYVGNILNGQRVVVRPHGYTDPKAKGVILSLTGIGQTPGHFTIYSGQSSNVPLASNINLTPWINSNNMAWVPLKSGGTFTVVGGGANSSNGLIIDQVGWFF